MARLLTHHRSVLPLAKLIVTQINVVNCIGEISGTVEDDVVMGVVSADDEVIGVLEEFEVGS